MREVIKYLARETNPISADTFYLIADQMECPDYSENCKDFGEFMQNMFTPYKDVAELVRYIVDTGHADLSGTDCQWDMGRAMGLPPTETLLAKCIRIRNYGLMRLLLAEYPEKFKDIINERITAFGVNPQGESELKCETDLHCFVLNQICSVKYWKDTMHYDTSYGKQIAFTVHTTILLFQKAGARFDIPDAKGKTVADYLREWKDKFPAGSIPKDVNIIR